MSLVRSKLPTSTSELTAAFYTSYFWQQVYKSLVIQTQDFDHFLFKTDYLQNAILCLSASHIAMLDCSPQCRVTGTNSATILLFSPNPNLQHLQHAEHYCQLATQRISVLVATGTSRCDDFCQILLAKTILAYYHHSATNHFQFREVVWETLRFVRAHHLAILRSSFCIPVLQLWFRLYSSCRMSKPPALFLEGQGEGSFTPNLGLSETDDDLKLSCILNNSQHNLIYNVLISTIEIRNRMIVNLCVQNKFGISEFHSNFGSFSHDVLSSAMQRPVNAAESLEANRSTMGEHNLKQLLETQRLRWRVWRSMLKQRDIPTEIESPRDQSLTTGSITTKNYSLPYHRAMMDYLYGILCELIFEELNLLASTPEFPANDPAISIKGGDVPWNSDSVRLMNVILDLIHNIDYRSSNFQDVYTFSLVEILRQIAFSCRSIKVLNHITSAIWPRIEKNGLGYEHSHLPTHLAKRLITFMAHELVAGRLILYSVIAVSEKLEKVNLLDIDTKIDVVVYGCSDQGDYFVHRHKLP